MCADVMESSSGNNNNSSSRATGGGRSNNPGAGFGLTSRPGSAATTSGGGSGGLGGGALCLNECVTPADYQYVVDKLYEQSIVSMTDVGLLEGKVKEAEEANRHVSQHSHTRSITSFFLHKNITCISTLITFPSRITAERGGGNPARAAPPHVHAQERG